MSNRRALHVVLNDIAAEFQHELDEMIKEDEELRGYSEGAREELTLRVKACRLGASALEIVNAQATEVL